MAPTCGDVSHCSLHGLWVDDPNDRKSFKTAMEFTTICCQPTDGPNHQAVNEPPEPEGTLGVSVPKPHVLPNEPEPKFQNPTLAPHVQGLAIEGLAEFRLASDLLFETAYFGTTVKSLRSRGEA